MKRLTKYILIIILILLSSCEKQKNKLVVDEIYISKHSVGPQMRNIHFILPDGGIREGTNEENSEFLKNNPCLKGIEISKSTYLPSLIIQVNHNGVAIGYFKNCLKKKEGYFKLVLSDSLLNYINGQIEKMNYRNLDTIYSGSGEGFTEYFVSIKKDNEEKQIMIMQDYEGTKVIRNFINSLNNYINKIELQDYINIPFRKDTLIVLKSEKYWNIYYPKK